MIERGKIEEEKNRKRQNQKITKKENYKIRTLQKKKITKQLTELRYITHC